MKNEKIWNASRICVSSLRRGHANLLCIVPILVYVLREQYTGEACIRQVSQIQPTTFCPQLVRHFDSWYVGLTAVKKGYYSRVLLPIIRSKQQLIYFKFIYVGVCHIDSTQKQYLIYHTVCPGYAALIKNVLSVASPVYSPARQLTMSQPRIKVPLKRHEHPPVVSGAPSSKHCELRNFVPTPQMAPQMVSMLRHLFPTYRPA